MIYSKSGVSDIYTSKDVAVNKGKKFKKLSVTLNMAPNNIFMTPCNFKTTRNWNLQISKSNFYNLKMN